MAFGIFDVCERVTEQNGVNGFVVAMIVLFMVYLIADISIAAIAIHRVGYPDVHES